MYKFWSIGALLFDVEGGAGAAVSEAPAGGGEGGSGGTPPDAMTAIITESIKPKEEAKAPTPEEEAEEAELAQVEAEVRAKNPNIKGSMDVARHQAVLTRNRNKWEAERKELAEKAERYEKLKAFEDAETQAALQALQLADQDPKQFLKLLRHDPRFAELIPEEVKQQAREDAKAEDRGERPKPNATTPDGTLAYYDDEGLQQLLDWHGSQILTKAEKQLLDKIEARFGPVEQEFKARNTWNQAIEKQRAVLNEAKQSWPHFEAVFPKVKERLNADKTLGLRDAYNLEIIPHLENQAKVNREQLRKELLDELNGKAKATIEKPGAQGVEHKASEEAYDIGEIIRRSIRHIER